MFLNLQGLPMILFEEPAGSWESCCCLCYTLSVLHIPHPSTEFMKYMCVHCSALQKHFDLYLVISPLQDARALFGAGVVPLLSSLDFASCPFAFRAERKNTLPHGTENICWKQLKGWEKHRRNVHWLIEKERSRNDTGKDYKKIWRRSCR